MEKKAFAKIANYIGKESKSSVPNSMLIHALDTLAGLLQIEFGSVTIHFHRGKWSQKIEIQQNIFRDIER